MVYRRRYRRRYRSYRPRYRRRYRKKYTSLKQKIESVVDKQKELKVHDLEPVQANITNTGTATLLNGIGQGDTGTTRDGDKILMKSIFIRGQIVADSAATNPQSARIVVIYIPENTAAPTWTSVFLSARITSPKTVLRDRVGKYVVMFDRTYNLSPASGVETKTFKWFKKLNHYEWFNDTGTTIASVGKGAFYMLSLSDQATSQPNLLYSSRIRYTDS